MFPVPHEGDLLILRRPGVDDVVEHLGTRTRYTYQLEALADALASGSRCSPTPTGRWPTCALSTPSLPPAASSVRTTAVP